MDTLYGVESPWIVTLADALAAKIEEHRNRIKKNNTRPPLPKDETIIVR
jgi:hypothetical protein